MCFIETLSLINICKRHSAVLKRKHVLIYAKKKTVTPYASDLSAGVIHPTACHYQNACLI